MRMVRFVLVMAAVPATAWAQTEIAGKISSVGLFKNGLALLTREYTLPGPGDHVAATVGGAIHGTLWIESAARITVRTETRTAAADPEAPAPLDLAEALVGQEVQLSFRDNSRPSMRGILLAAPSHSSASANRTYFSTTYPSEAVPMRSAEPAVPYVIEDGGGRRHYLAADTVTSVVSLGALNPGGRPSEKPVLIFDVPDDAEGPVTVQVSYLARGLSWAPSYRIDLSDPERLRIGQSTVIRNEIGDLEVVDTHLISGFPSVEFEQVASPLVHGMSWNEFFGSLNRPSGRNMHIATQNIISNNADFMAVGDFFDTGAMAEAEGPDLHYQPFGALTLARGHALTRIVAEAEAKYQRVVEWRVPEIREHRSASNDGTANQQAHMWDAVRFKNPFDFPMTTAPAMVMADGRFLGSRTTHWAGPGGETLAYISKTLSIRATATEVETGRTEVPLTLRTYRQSTLEGTLTLRNQRNEAVEVVIHKELEGALIEADGEPSKVVGASGPGRLNPSVKLTWRLTLQPGEAREVKYTYEYLIP